MELILIKITSLPTENQEASICSQAIPYMRSDIFNFVYHLLNNEFLNNSEQEHFLLVKGNVLSRRIFQTASGHQTQLPLSLCIHEI